MQVQMVALYSVSSKPHSNVRLLVATTEFGIGIDCKDIKNIIYWGPPSNCQGVCPGTSWTWRPASRSSIAQGEVGEVYKSRD